MEFEDLAEFDTQLTADVVAWCPSSLNSNILACGTYFLDKEIKKRQGCIYMLNMDFENGRLILLNKFNFHNTGVLDLKWIGENRIVTIDSDNTLRLLGFDGSNLNLVFEKRNECEAAIGLTLDCFKDNSSINILTADTNGFLTLHDLNDDKLESIERFKAHDFEVWSVLIDQNEKNILYSGADDCLLKIWDLRESKGKCSKSCKIFEGGVTSIILPQRPNAPNQMYTENYNENNVLCSSYDERIYVLDKRNLKTPVKQSNKLNGGVWKMKLHSNKNLILCACMHTG